MLQRHVNQHFSTKEDNKTPNKKGLDSNASGYAATNGHASTKATKKGTASNNFLDSIGPYGVKALLETQSGDVYLARKSAVNPAAMKFSSSAKNLKHVGVRLKYRKSVFSARNFDFFDAGVMEGVKEAVNKLENISRDIFGIDSRLRINFEAAEVLAIRNNGPGEKRSALVRWSPKNL